MTGSADTSSRVGMNNMRARANKKHGHAQTIERVCKIRSGMPFAIDRLPDEGCALTHGQAPVERRLATEVTNAYSRLAKFARGRYVSAATVHVSRCNIITLWVLHWAAPGRWRGRRSRSSSRSRFAFRRFMGCPPRGATSLPRSPHFAPPRQPHRHLSRRRPKAITACNICRHSAARNFPHRPRS